MLLVALLVTLTPLGCGGLPAVSAPGEPGTPSSSSSASPSEHAGGAGGVGPAAPAPPGTCSIRPPPPALDPPKLDRTAAGPSRVNLRAWIDLLTADSLRGRWGGSDDTQRVASLLAREFMTLGWSGPPPDGDLCRAFEREGVADQNVVAHFRRAPGASGGPVVILGAHYDAQGVDASGAIYPGADDNASGVAALMEVARLVAADPKRAGSDLVLIAFGAEERGVLGARAYVERPTVLLARVPLMINLDMVGRRFFDGNPLRLLLPGGDDAIGYTISARGQAGADARLRKAAHATGTRVVGAPETMMQRMGYSADSVIFSEHVPTLFLSTALHGDYHRPTDTADKIDLGQIERVIGLVLAMIKDPFPPAQASSPTFLSQPGAH